MSKNSFKNNWNQDFPAIFHAGGFSWFHVPVYPLQTDPRKISSLRNYFSAKSERRIKKITIYAVFCVVFANVQKLPLEPAINPAVDHGLNVPILDHHRCFTILIGSIFDHLNQVIKTLEKLILAENFWKFKNRPDHKNVPQQNSKTCPL